MTDNGSVMSIIAFLIHSVIFIIMIILAVMNTSLLSNSNYVNMLYIVLGTLVLHGGYAVGKTSKTS
jgi:hypothetical protein